MDYEGSSLKFRTQKVAEDNEKNFNSFLEKLPNASGVYLYEITSGEAPVFFDEVHNIFYHLKDQGGYRKYSLSTRKDLSVKEESELYHDVGLGIVEVWQVPLVGVGKTTRIWHGETNIAPRVK